MNGEQIVAVIEALTNAVLTIGLKSILILAILIYALYQMNRFFKDKDEKFYYNSMLKEKNISIERLADDNRRYREVYLKKVLKLTEEDYREISAEEIQLNN